MLIHIDNKYLHIKKYLLFFLSKGILNFSSDECFLKIRYYLMLNKKLNLTNPTDFNEKLQWLKIYNHNSEYTMMADKYSVKKYVEEKVGKKYVVPTLGVWERADVIDFDSLPERFVLKCTHDSGGLVICKDKESLDVQQAKNKISKSLNRNYYWYGREWPYKNVEPRIIAESYLEGINSSDGLIDYKFYCFHGLPKFLYVSQGLGGNHKEAMMNFVDLDWEKTPFQRPDFKGFDVLPNKPRHFGEMIEIAKKLSKDIPFVRVDLYEVDDQVYFSELTFYPGSGFTPFDPPEWEKEIGSWIHLEEV